MANTERHLYSEEEGVKRMEYRVVQVVKHGEGKMSKLGP